MDRELIEKVLWNIFDLFDSSQNTHKYFLAYTLLDAMSTLKDNILSVPYVNSLIALIKNYMEISYPMLNIDWIIQNSRNKRDKYERLSSLLERKINSTTITAEDKNILQNMLNQVIDRVPELRIIKTQYFDRVSAETSGVLRPSDDPDFYDKNINDLVGSFLFKGRKSRRKSGRKIYKYKSQEKFFRTRKSPKESRKPKKSK